MKFGISPVGASPNHARSTIPNIVGLALLNINDPIKTENSLIISIRFLQIFSIFNQNGILIYNKQVKHEK